MGAFSKQTPTLAVDCGGGGIKACVLDGDGTMLAPGTRTPTPYPLTPETLVDVIDDLATRLPAAGRVTVGMPGMIRHGVVIHTPHYITRSGPRTRVLPQLEAQWSGFDMRSALEDRLSLATLVFNDAEVHGAGAITGSGSELMLTFGTGLGAAHFDGGRLAPHLELSALPSRWGLTFDEYIGEHERLRLGDSQWSRRVRRVIESLRPAFLWDRVFIGGGNSRRLTAHSLAKLPDDAVVVSNNAGITGGVRAWQLPMSTRTAAS